MRRQSAPLAVGELSLLELSHATVPARVEREGLIIDRRITSVRMNAPLPPAAFIRKVA